MNNYLRNFVSHFDIVVQYRIALTRTGCSENQGRTKRIDDVDPASTPLGFIAVTGRQIDRILIAEISFLLKKTFVIVVERIIGKRLFQKTTKPDSGSQQAEVPGGKGQDITADPQAVGNWQDEQEVIEEEQREADACGPGDMLLRNFAVADALCAVAAQGEKQKGAELGNHGPREQTCRLLDVQQDAIGNGVGQNAVGPPFIAEPVGVQNEEKDTETAGELHDAFERP